MAQTSLPGTQVIPFQPNAPALSGQIIPSRGIPTIKPADVISVRNVNIPSITGPTAGARPSPRIGSGLLSGMLKGGIVGGLATPNTMGDSTLSGAYARGDMQRENVPGKIYVEGWGYMDDPDYVAESGMSKLGEEPIPFMPPTGPSGSPTASANPAITAPIDAGLMGAPNIPAPSVPTKTINVDGGSATVPAAMAGSTFAGVGEYNNAARPVSDLMSSGRAAYDSQNLADFMGYNDNPNTPTEQFLDPQGRLRRRYKDSGKLTENYSSYEKAAAEREDRAAQQAAGFGRAVSDRERRGTGEMSMADAADIFGSNEAGRAAILKQRQGIDPYTNRPIDEGGRTQREERERLLNEKLKQEIADGNKPEATALQKRKGELAEALEGGIITQSQYDDQLKRSVLGNPPTGYNTWAEYESATGTDVDGDGKVGGDGNSTVATRDGGSTPPASNNDDPLGLGL